VWGEQTMTNTSNNRSKHFVNDDGDESNIDEKKDILAARAKSEQAGNDLRIALFRKVKLELSAA